MSGLQAAEADVTAYVIRVIDFRTKKVNRKFGSGSRENPTLKWIENVLKKPEKKGPEADRTLRIEDACRSAVDIMVEAGNFGSGPHKDFVVYVRSLDHAMERTQGFKNASPEEKKNHVKPATSYITVYIGRYDEMFEYEGHIYVTYDAEGHINGLDTSKHPNGLKMFSTQKELAAAVEAGLLECPEGYCSPV